MNIYQMYVANGNKVGFYIKRSSWGNTLAFVTYIDGKSEGKLKGRAPYYSNPIVKAILYKRVENTDKFQIEEENFIVSCPGTYKYTQIEID